MKFHSNRPKVGILANCTSVQNRSELIHELGEPEDGFFKPLPFKFKDIQGEIIALDVQPHEILGKSGMVKAKEAMLKAVDTLAKRGVKVICFTASTKRLPGKSGLDIKSLYPSIVFSIGDNATTISFQKIIDHIISNSDTFNLTEDEIVCMGAGFLGTHIIEHLIKRGAKNITVISEYPISGLSDNIQFCKSLIKIPDKTRLFISCTHKHNVDPVVFGPKLTSDAIIVDVAVPAGISKEVFNALPQTIKRYDAGDFFLPAIHYDFPPTILSFPEVGFWYGCFTEAVMLNMADMAGEDLRMYNFFEVNDTNCDMISKYLKLEEVLLPLINFHRPGEMKFIGLLNSLLVN